MASNRILYELAAHALETSSADALITAVHFPPPYNTCADMQDAFACVQLDSRVTGLAYASLPVDATQHTATGQQANALIGRSAKAVIQDVVSLKSAQRPLAIATLNAVLLQHNADALRDKTELCHTLLAFEHPETIGMVGYFESLVPAFIDAGHKLRVAELDPSTWRADEGLIVAGTPEVLTDCETVFCTATVLLNDTFASIRRAAARCKRFVLLGPTTPLAPKVLARYGVSHIASRFATDQSAFWAACQSGTDWTQFTHKYLLETQKNARAD